jgi:CubicO group peptidase (beta-lactamase class C family)
MQKLIEMRRIRSDRRCNSIKHRLSIALLLLSPLFNAGCNDASWDGPAPHDNLDSSENPNLPTYISIGPENTGDGWFVSNPDMEGINADLLYAALDSIRSGNYPGTDSVVVVRNGKLVAEAYYNGYGRDTLHDIRSASKSITSALAGIAIDQGVISTEDSLSQLIKLDNYQNPDPRKEAIKLINLLNMNSGLACDDWDLNSPGQEEKIYRSSDWVKFILDLPMLADPGARQSRYCTGGVILLGNIISVRSGTNLDDFANTYLFGPLGINDMRWRRAPDGQATGGGGLWLRPRDAAKFGQLYLNQGLWQGKRIITSQWIEESKQSMTSIGASKVDGYGLLWWKRNFLLRASTQTAFFAAGNGGNYIFILPEEELVVVFTASNYNSTLTDQPFDIFVQRILPALR